MTKERKGTKEVGNGQTISTYHEKTVDANGKIKKEYFTRKCPLMKTTCLRQECMWWRRFEERETCAVALLTDMAVLSLYQVRGSRINK